MRATSIRVRNLAYVVTASLLFAPSLLHAQAKGSTFDRTKIPAPGPAPTLHVPQWTETTLPNGVRLIVVEKHDLPLVTVAVNFVGGSNQYETANKHGVADLVTSTMTEGTTTRSAEQIANEMLLLGTNIGASITGESGIAGFSVLTKNFTPSLALFADILTHPTFPTDAIERTKARALVGLQQSRAQVRYLSSRAFGHLVYGPQHPYGWTEDEGVVKSLTRDDVVSFYKAYFAPSHAVIVVAGDVKVADVRNAVGKALAGWTGGSAPVAFSYPSVPAAAPTTIYIVDKPGAAQSNLLVGLPGPSRNTQDYYALQVMNMIVGGLFQSRLNYTIREEKGWSYGVTSIFAFGRGPGPFRAGGDIVTAKTDSAVIEVMRTLRGAQGGRPFTADELSQGKAALIQSLPERFASVSAISQSISQIYTQDLPKDYWQTFAARVNAVTADDLTRVAKQYIDLNHLAIVIAGDRAAIENGLRASGVAPVVVLDANFNPVKTTQ